MKMIALAAVTLPLLFISIASSAQSPEKVFRKNSLLPKALQSLVIARIDRDCKPENQEGVRQGLYLSEDKTLIVSSGKEQKTYRSVISGSFSWDGYHPTNVEITVQSAISVSGTRETFEIISVESEKGICN